MALWFPVMVNNHKIGYVEITRRDDQLGPVDGESIYDWEVTHLNTPVEGVTPRWHSWRQTGEVRHHYSDGPFGLIQKVMEACEK